MVKKYKPIFEEMYEEVKNGRGSSEVIEAYTKKFGGMNSLKITRSFEDFITKKERSEKDMRTEDRLSHGLELI